MKIKFVDLKAGFDPIEYEIFEAIKGVFSSMQLHLGPNNSAFEEDFAKYCGTSEAVTLNSGTDALIAALKACSIGSGDEIITTPHSFFATTEAIMTTGAIPVFVDIEEESYNIDPNLIEEKITEKTRAILPVHMYGNPANMNKIVEIAKKHDLYVIEDACQAHGAVYNGKRCGSMGDIGCFSFYYTKNLGAYGEGGAVTTSSKELFDFVRLYRNHGHKSKYEHDIIGSNGRFDEIQAAILRIKLNRLSDYIAKRQKIAATYNELLTGLPLVLPKVGKESQHVFHLYVVRSDKRDGLQEHLRSCEIETGIHYKNPIHLQEAVKSLGYKLGNFPIAEKICNEIISLPIYPELTEEQTSYVASKVRAFF